MRKAVLGMGVPSHVSYARRAGEVCGLLQAGTIVVEDVPMFVPAVRRSAGKEPRIILHQHMAGPVSMPHRFWQRVTDSLDGAIFVADETDGRPRPDTGSCPYQLRSSTTAWT